MTRPVQPGDPAPVFIQACTNQHGRYSFDMAGGYDNLLVFFTPEQEQVVSQTLALFRELLRDREGGRCRVFCVMLQADYVPAALVALSDVILIDEDRKVRELYGFSAGQCALVLVDPLLRVRDIVTPEIPDAAFRLIRGLNPVGCQDDRPVPALILDRVLESDVCAALIRYFHAQPAISSPVLTQTPYGRPMAATDRSFKRRFDRPLKNRALVGVLQDRIIRRVVPEIGKVFQCVVTGMDRMLVACYDSSDQGCFGAHRDNTINGARHRLFAISLNLNDDFEGGDLWFPEFSTRGFKPSAGGAVIFSCALLHAVRPVTQGRRYACLPFVFNEASREHAARQDAQ
ncbi:2OG-Fe(II) oxygenase [Acetobacter musti]|uniref:2OG-Fe(II) oxygenase n=1 Tax=Acetobacter musti TaxID=864732 RepID=A0ABX0JZG7_9PROT|nr:2OG-Fe(II) oxygenase [Acetobacter musti]NHN86889.1 2OG-Fe(II) oxygenase [Acetobacter musti]